jgi:hypothetical protein
MSTNSLDDISVRTSAPPALSIVELIMECIASKKASPKSIDTMNILLKNELEMLKAMDANLISIMKDGKLDMADIPDIILLMKHTSNLFSPKLKTLKVNRRDLIIFIREVLIMVVSSDLLEIKNREVYVKMIHSGTDLLEATVDLDDTIRCNFRWCCC